MYSVINQHFEDELFKFLSPVEDPFEAYTEAWRIRHAGNSTESHHPARR